MTLIIISTAASLYNRQVMIRTAHVQEQSKLMKGWSEDLFRGLHRSMDISVRGFAVIHEDRFIITKPEGARKSALRNFHRIDSLGALQEYVDSAGYMRQFKAAFLEHINVYEQMIELARQDSMTAFKAILSQDQGKAIWERWDRANKQLTAFENKLFEEAQADYEAAMNRNVLIQLLLTVFGLPTLGVLMYKLRQDAVKRHALLLKLKQTNREYVFDPGDDASITDDQELVEESIGNFKKALGLIKQLGAGNYEATWEGLHKGNSALNQHNLAGELKGMRKKMNELKQTERQRLWLTEGQAQFAEIVRLHQHDLAALVNQTLTFLVKYLNAQQGSLFVLDEEASEPHLNLAACYAFNRKKYLEKRIAAGQGLAGQAYLEAETTLLTEIPRNYTFITSGLGDATPTCLLIVPAKYNDRVEAVVEMAGFVRYEAYQVAFVEKAGEILASTIISAKNSEKMHRLLEDSNMQSEQMRAQEEEMRQNLEELMATQEQQLRLEVELRENADQLEQQLAELKESKATLEQKESELRAANEKTVKRSRQYKEKMEALDADIENKNSQINVLKRNNEELLQKLAGYEAKDNS
jgi:CHASE3 domain sensor protein/GAF domain-containing protein